MIYGIGKYKDRDKFRGVHTGVMHCVYKGTEENGTVCTSNPESLEELRNIKSDKDIVRRNPIRKNELENGYRYYMSRIDEIPKDFRKALEEYGKQEIVAYYVASMREDKVHELYVEPTKDIEK